MTEIIVLLSIAGYIMIGAFTWRVSLRRYFRNLIGEQIAEAERDIQLYRSTYGDKRDQENRRAEALKVPDFERSYAIGPGLLSGLFWPAYWVLVSILSACRNAVSLAIDDAVTPHRELARLREIAKQEGWQL